MPKVTVADWLEGQMERVLARQRTQVDTAKLIATFSTAVSASLVATGLQVAPATDADRNSLSLLLISFVLALAVAFADRIREVDHRLVLEEAAAEELSEQQKLVRLARASIIASRFNDRVVRLVRAILLLQLMTAAFAAAVSAIPLAAAG